MFGLLPLPLRDSLLSSFKRCKCTTIFHTRKKNFGLQGCKLIFQMLLSKVASSQARFYFLPIIVFRIETLCFQHSLDSVCFFLTSFLDFHPCLVIDISETLWFWRFSKDKT